MQQKKYYSDERDIHVSKNESPQHPSYDEKFEEKFLGESGQKIDAEIDTNELIDTNHSELSINDAKFALTTRGVIRTMISYNPSRAKTGHRNKLIEYSIDRKKIVRSFGKWKKEFANLRIHILVAATPDRKSIFITDESNRFIYKYSFRTFKLISQIFDEKDEYVTIENILVTNDNRYLMVMKYNSTLDFFCVKTLKLVKRLKIYLKARVKGKKIQACSPDSKYLLIGDGNANIIIVDVERGESLKINISLEKKISSISVLKDSQHAYIGDENNNIGMLTWKPNPRFLKDVKFVEIRKLKKRGIYSMCLTNDEKFLIVGAPNSVKFYNLLTDTIMYRQPVSDNVIGITLIKNGKGAQILQKKSDAKMLGYNVNEIDFNTMKVRSVLSTFDEHVNSRDINGKSKMRKVQFI